MEVLVLGAGVSGLSCGVLLLKGGFKVTIWAKDLPPNTTSDKAAAAWSPYLCYPKEKVARWAKNTLVYFHKEIAKEPKSGFLQVKTSGLFTKKGEDPEWKNNVPGYKKLHTKTLPNGYMHGYEFEGMVIDTSFYMDYLVSLFKKLGGVLIQKEISSIQEAFTRYNLVVNCTGLGSRQLFGDKLVYPVRGQMIKIKPNGFNRVVADEEGPNSLAVIIPRLNDIMIGGTTQENNWNLEIDPEDSKDIMKKVTNLYPEFKNAEIIGESVGLRPVRPEIRLESQYFGDQAVIHNYGHGGAGFTLSWGCAQEVVDLVQKAISPLQ